MIAPYSNLLYKLNITYILSMNNRICWSKFVKKCVTIAPPNNIWITQYKSLSVNTNIDDLDFIYSFKYIPFISILIGQSAPILLHENITCTRHTFTSRILLKKTSHFNEWKLLQYKMPIHQENLTDNISMIVLLTDIV